MSSNQYRKSNILILGAVFFIVIPVLIFDPFQNRQSLKFESVIIEPDALAAIDFDELEPAVAEFIELAQADQVIDRPMSDFPDFWSHAEIKDDWGNDSSSKTYPAIVRFPMNEEKRQENDERKSLCCFPQMTIWIWREEQTIKQVALVDFCF